MNDVQQSQRAGQRLADEHGAGDPYGAALRGARMAIVITDSRQDDHPIIFANDAFLHLTGYRRDEVIGRNCRFLQGRDTDPRAIALLREAVAGGRDAAVELLNYRKDGSTFWNSLSLSPVRDEAGVLTYFFASQSDVGGRKAEELALLRSREGLQTDVDVRQHALELALERQESLLHEVDHRVKNNLQLISSLLLLQSRRLGDSQARLALCSMLERVNAIATVHRRLFRTDDVEKFDLAEFLRDLVADLAMSAGRDDLQVRLDLDHVAVPASQAAPLALVANELIGNALKHPFPAGRAGAVTVTLRRDDGQVELSVADDGVGRGDAPTNFGLTIVQLLGRQLRAEIRLEAADPGFRAVVRLPVETAAA